jgi:superfamily II DNA or RNA helicase
MSDFKVLIGNSWCYIKSSEALPFEFLKVLSYVDKQQTFKAYSWSGRYEPVRKYLVNRKSKAFPTGLLPFVKTNFPDWEYIDEREKPEVDWQPFPQEMEYKEGHQATALQKMIDMERGTIEGVTAMGKSYLEAGFASVFEHPVLIISHRKEIAKNILIKCQDMIGADDVGVVFANKIKPKRVTVGMIGSLTSRMDDLQGWMNSLKAILVDEAHHCSVGSQYFTFMQACKNAYFRYGLTASPWREQGDTLAIFALTGPVIFTYPYAQALEEGVVVPVEVYMAPVSSNVSMPILDNFKLVYDKGIVFNDDRNERIAKIITHLYNKGENALVLVWRTEHGRLISEKLVNVPHEYIHGTSPNRDSAKTSFENGDNQILIASSIYDEGVDIERVQNVIIAAGYKAPRLSIQRVGRGMRPMEGKERCRVFDFFDTCHANLQKHSQERLKFYKKMGFKVSELHL